MGEEGGKLEASLSFPVILLITINSIMGTGIFFLPALGALEAGPMSVISWAVMAVIAIGISLVFAELASMFPTAGGIYEYCKQAFGAFPSFIIGWATLVVGNITIAMLVVGAIQYLNPTMPNVYKIAFSLVFILLFNFMAFRGMQTSAVMLVVFAFITLISVFGLLIPGLFFFRPENYQPFVTHDVSAVLLTVFVIAETFFGWETATFLAEETKDAERVIPKALIIGTIIIALIAVAFVTVSLGVINWEIFGMSQTPLADIAGAIYGDWGVPVFSILVYISIIGSVAGWIVSAPRLLMTLAEDKMFIDQLAAIHPVHKTPYKAIIFQTVVTSFLVVWGAGNYETLLHLLVPMVLILYAMVIIAMIVMRFSKPDHTRPYKMPLGVPLASFLALVVFAIFGFWMFTVSYAYDTLSLAGTLLLIGLPVYILLKFTYDPDAVISSAKFTTKINHAFEDLFLPKEIRKEIVGLLTLSDKRVLEYGANVGTLTIMLAEEIGPNGQLYASEVSKPNAKLIERRVKKRGQNHVHVIHDEHQVNRIHPEVDAVDVVVSVGFLSFVQDLPKVLHELRSRMQERDQVLFVDYVDYFKIIPNAGAIADQKKLAETFRAAGFSVRIEKKKGFLWNYLVVHGIRTDRDVPFV